MKTLQELNLLSKFLFDQTMDMPWLRSVRLDVFAVDEERRIYDTEMQGKWRGDLLKRSRYYQGLIDSSLLEPGSVDFNALNDTCIIMITPFDLFGKGKYCYTFYPYCKEDKDILLKDGAVRIFLNTRGTNDGEVHQELVDFLHYIECTDETFAEQTGSKNILKIHECVKKIKSSEEMGVKYMQTWEEKIMERQEGRLEGRQEGRLEGEQRLAELMRLLMNAGRNEDMNRILTDESYRKQLYEEFHISYDGSADL